MSEYSEAKRCQLTATKNSSGRETQPRFLGSEWRVHANVCVLAMCVELYVFS